MSRREFYREISPLEFILMRQALGLGRYRKTRPRDPSKWRILKAMYLARMEQSDRDDFLFLGFRRRRVIVSCRPA
jgi:hypothetical protein